MHSDDVDPGGSQPAGSTDRGGIAIGLRGGVAEGLLNELTEEAFP